MEYRKLAKGNEKISEIGFGAGHLREANDEEIEKIFRYGFDSGINFMDTVSYEETFAKPVKKVLKDYDDVKTQIHIGAVYPNGQYTQSRNLDYIEKTFEGELEKYGVDYVDFGMIHYVDTVSDFNKILNNGIFDYALRLKDEGVIGHIGVSSHTPSVVEKFIPTGEIDIIMLSLNPSIDFVLNNGKLALSEERYNFYRKCVQNKVSISVMKPFSGGKLLNKDLSPLKVELSTGQCIQYALDRPSVVSVLPGVSSLDNLKDVLNFYNMSEEERNYNFIGDLTNHDLEGNCIYCNHCRPCTAGLEIGLINKLYDLSRIGDSMAKEHYLSLEKHASDCIKCGRCEEVCAFNVPIIKRMEETSSYYGL